MTTETFKHEWRLYTVDVRIGRKRARKLLDGKAINLDHPVEGQNPCQFQPGETLVIEPHRLWLEITTVKAKGGKWLVHYLLADHRPNLMGKKAGTTHDPSKAMKADYTDPDGVRRDELEQVDPDWVDPGVAGRKVRRQEAETELAAEHKAREESRKVKARMDQVMVDAGKKGVDMTEELADIYARLSDIEKKAA